MRTEMALLGKVPANTYYTETRKLVGPGGSLDLWKGDDGYNYIYHRGDWIRIFTKEALEAWERKQQIEKACNEAITLLEGYTNNVLLEGLCSDLEYLIKQSQLPEKKKEQEIARLRKLVEPNEYSIVSEQLWLAKAKIGTLAKVEASLPDIEAELHRSMRQIEQASVAFKHYLSSSLLNEIEKYTMNFSGAGMGQISAEQFLGNIVEGQEHAAPRQAPELRGYSQLAPEEDSVYQGILKEHRLDAAGGSSENRIFEFHPAEATTTTITGSSPSNDMEEEELGLVIDESTDDEDEKLVEKKKAELIVDEGMTVKLRDCEIEIEKFEPMLVLIQKRKRHTFLLQQSTGDMDYSRRKTDHSSRCGDTTVGGAGRYELLGPRPNRYSFLDNLGEQTARPCLVAQERPSTLEATRRSESRQREANAEKVRQANTKTGHQGPKPQIKKLEKLWNVWNKNDREPLPGFVGRALRRSHLPDSFHAKVKETWQAKETFQPNTPK